MRFADYKVTLKVMGVVLGMGVLIWATRSTPQRFTYSEPPPPADALSPHEHLAIAATLTAPKDLLEAKKHLDAIPQDAPEFKEAQPLKANVERQLAQIEEAFQLGQREGFAKIAEKYFLKEGYDMYVTLSGKDKTTIKFNYALMSRPVAYNAMEDSNFVQQLRERGFRRIIFTDGYRSWEYGL
jgi:hypothetical protein